MRVPEDGDEFVRVYLRFDCAERGVAGLMCKRGAYYMRWRREKRQRKGALSEGGNGKDIEERKGSPCTRHTSP